MTKFYDAERVILPLMLKRDSIDIKELKKFCKKLSKRCKSKGFDVCFDISPASIFNALNYMPFRLKYNGSRIYKDMN